MGFVAGLTLLAGGLQAYGQYSAGQAQGRAEDRNAATQREAARLSLEKGEFEAQQIRKAGLKLTGSQEARYAANGVALSGSPLMVMEESQANYETDALLEKYNAKIEAKRYASDAEYRTQLAYNYRMSGLVNAGSTLISSAAMAGMNYGFRGADSRLQSQVGAFGGGTSPYTARVPQGNNLTFRIRN